MQKFKVERSEVEKALEDGDYNNSLAVSYRLVMDNMRIEEDPATKESRQ